MVFWKILTENIPGTKIDACKFLEFSVFLSARMSYLKQCGHLFGELQGEGAGLIPVPACSVNSFLPVFCH